MTAAHASAGRPIEREFRRVDGQNISTLLRPVHTRRRVATWPAARRDRSRIGVGQDLLADSLVDERLRRHPFERLGRHTEVRRRLCDQLAIDVDEL
jgi:hypothetical protein